MRIAYTLLIFAIWMAALPYLGFTHFWKDILTVISSLILVFISYTIYAEAKAKEIQTRETFENFSENEFEAEKQEETANN